MPHRFARTFGATAILAAIVIAGFIQFADSDPHSPTEIDTDPSASVQTDGTKPDPAPEDTPFTYRIGVLQGPSTLNFWEYNGTPGPVWDAYILAPTKASLYRLDGKSLELEPELASSIVTPTRDEEGWKVVVPLRDDMKWSDGTAMTAGDISFTFSTVRRLNLGGNWASSFPNIVTAVEASDANTLVIRFDERPGLEVWPHAIGTAPVMAEHVWADAIEHIGTATEIYDLDSEVDVSGGPLELVDVRPNVVISRSNPGYIELMAETVEYHIYDTEEDLVAALNNGQVDTLLTPKGITEQNAALLANSPGVTMLNTPTFGVRYLGFNLHRTPMSDLEFREAVAYLLEREEMAADFASTASAASTMISDSNPLWYDEEKSAEIAEQRSGSLRDRLSKAIAGLKRIGYTWTTEPFVDKGRVVAGSGLLIDGVSPAPLTILTPGDKYDPARPLYAEEIASKIELLGYSVVPLETDFSTVVDLAFTPEEDGSRQYDMVLLGWSLGNPALPGFYSEIFGSNGIANNTGYSRQKMEKLIERFRLATSIPQARGIVWEMEGLIADDLPYLPLYRANIIEAYRGDLVEIDIEGILGGIQSTLGAFAQVTPKT